MVTIGGKIIFSYLGRPLLVFQSTRVIKGPLLKFDSVDYQVIELVRFGERVDCLEQNQRGLIERKEIVIVNYTSV